MSTINNSPSSIKYEKIDDHKSNRHQNIHVRDEENSNKSRVAFDWLFLKRFTSIIKILYGGGGNAISSLEACWPTMVISFILVGLVGLNVWVMSYTGDVTGGFFQAIVDKDKEEFKRVFILSALVIAGSALIDSTIKFVVELLAWSWRKTLCLYIHDNYFVRTLYYKLVSIDRRIDNPDQRITQDVDKFTTTLATIVSSVLSAPINIVLYTYRTYTTIDWFAPLIIFGYFFVGYVINKLIMGPIAKLVFQQEKLEGDFRFDHVRVRTHAESIAIYDGGHREKINAEKTFQELLRNKLRILKWHWSLNSSSNTFAYCGGVLNYLIVALPVLFVHDKKVVPSPLYVGKASFACIMLVSAFSQFMNVSQLLSDLAGFTARIAHLLEILYDIEQKEEFSLKSSVRSSSGAAVSSSSPSSSSSVYVPYNGSVLKGDDQSIGFNDVTCYTPNGVKLVENLTFDVRHGANLLIMGPSGCGKSSIIRILNGLWRFYDGDISKPDDDHDDNNNNHNHHPKNQLFYLPQKPYLFRGTLREQILYPLEENEESAAHHQFSTEYLMDLLDQLHLGHLVQTYDIEKDEFNWPDVLSPGEQQLISFARLLLHAPSFAILDEATSSLPEDVERSIYDLCQQRNIALLSVGHRKSLLPYHQMVLQLNRQQQWKLSENSFYTNSQNDVKNKNN